MNEVVSIRPYQTSDLTALLDLIDLNIPNYFAFTEKEDFENYLEQERELYFVISLGDKIVGCGGINFEDKKRIGIISWDIIHPDYQGKSLGTQLLQHRMQILEGMKTVRKTIVRTSQLTYLFYQKQGFELKEKVVDYWAKGFDLNCMEFINKTE